VICVKNFSRAIIVCSAEVPLFDIAMLRHRIFAGISLWMKPIAAYPQIDVLREVVLDNPGLPAPQ
jgi:hypothetical protein